jgi:predicted hotdog family 3-hydroxylacyl-ACP dehydratase
MIPQLSPTLLTKDWIAAHIPHQGSMCLLDGVKEYGAEHIVCVTSSHSLMDNPLRVAERLGMATGIEYAAQAMAVHCALLAETTELSQNTKQSTQGYIAAIRAVSNNLDHWDHLPGKVYVIAERQSAMDSGAMYAFRLEHAYVVLQSGRVTLMFEKIAGEAA